MARNIEKTLYYIIDFKEDSVGVKSIYCKPEKGYVIEVNPNVDNKGNGYYPIRFLIDGKIEKWKTEHFEIVELSNNYNWQDLSVSFLIKTSKEQRPIYSGYIAVSISMKGLFHWQKNGISVVNFIMLER